jgi:hypothetical protein
MINNKLNYKLPEKPYIEAVRTENADITKIKSTKKNKSKINSRKIILRLIQSFRSLIRRKKMNFQFFMPPTVNEDYELITGEHKYQAYLAENEKTLPVVVIRFKEYENLPPEYWVPIWQSVENDPSEKDYVEELRDDEQIVRTTVLQIQQNIIKPTVDDITKSLKHQNIHKQNRPKYITEILSKVNSNVNVAKSYTSDTLEKYVDENFDIQEISSSQKLVKCDDDTVYLKQIFKPIKSKDFDNRAMIDCINSLQLYPEAKIKVFYSINSCDEEEIKKYRLLKNDLPKNFFEKMKYFVENHKPEDIEMIPIPQLPSEIND